MGFVSAMRGEYLQAFTAMDDDGITQAHERRHEESCPSRVRFMMWDLVVHCPDNANTQHLQQQQLQEGAPARSILDPIEVYGMYLGQQEPGLLSDIVYVKQVEILG